MKKIFLSLLNELKRFGGLLGACLVAIVLFAVIPASATPINISFTNSLGETYTEDGFTFTRHNGTPDWSIESGSGFATDWLNIHDHKVEGHYLELTSAAGAFGIYDLQFRIDRADEAPLRITNDLGGFVDLLYDKNDKSAHSYSFDSTWDSVSWVRFDSGHDISIGNINLEDSPVATPEPSTMLLLGAGLGGLALFRRRFRRS